MWNVLVWGTEGVQCFHCVIDKHKAKQKRTREDQWWAASPPQFWPPAVHSKDKLEFSNFSSVQSLSHVLLFVTPWTAAHQASLSITNSQSLLKLMSIELVMPSNHLILCCPLLLLHSVFPSIGFFPVSQFFESGGQSIGVSASASVLPMNIQDWFPLGLTGLILQPKGLSESSPTPQFKSINSLALSFLYSPTRTSIHDYWKNHSFGWMDLCWQSNVSAF